MDIHPLRVYADISVFGGVFDEEFARPSRAFFEQVRQGRFQLVSSVLVEREVEESPLEVQHLFAEIRGRAELLDVSEAAVRLQAAYLAAGVVTRQWDGDALHVAVATVAGCSAIVSWNFKHIVHISKIRWHNAVNALHGYAELAIHSPVEVVTYEGEEV
jgi:hypothetical protein